MGRSKLIRHHKNKQKSRGIIFVNITLGLLIIYFVYHALHGDRSIFEYRKLSSEVIIQQQKLDEINDEKAQYERRLSLVGERDIDPDLLDELARRKLGTLDQDEEMIILQQDGP
jgi:cell division protein FtsB